MQKVTRLYSTLLACRRDAPRALPDGRWICAASHLVLVIFLHAVCAAVELGSPIEEVFAQYGRPTSTRKVGGETWLHFARGTGPAVTIKMRNGGLIEASEVYTHVPILKTGAV